MVVPPLRHFRNNEPQLARTGPGKSIMIFDADSDFLSQALSRLSEQPLFLPMLIVSDSFDQAKHDTARFPLENLLLPNMDQILEDMIETADSGPVGKYPDCHYPECDCSHTI